MLPELPLLPFLPVRAEGSNGNSELESRFDRIELSELKMLFSVEVVKLSAFWITCSTELRGDWLPALCVFVVLAVWFTVVVHIALWTSGEVAESMVRTSSASMYRVRPSCLRLRVRAFERRTANGRDDSTSSQFEITTSRTFHVKLIETRAQRTPTVRNQRRLPGVAGSKAGERPRKHVSADCQSVRAACLSGDAFDRPADPRSMVLDPPQFATAFLVKAAVIIAMPDFRFNGKYYLFNANY